MSRFMQACTAILAGAAVAIILTGYVVGFMQKTMTGSILPGGNPPASVPHYQPVPDSWIKIGGFL